MEKSRICRRFLALFLALCLTVGMVPVTVFAAEDEKPIDETEALIEETATPTKETEVLIEETEAPTEETEAPTEETEAPTEETEAPTEETEAPTEETEAPTEETEAPTEETEAPTEETEAPTEETEAPTEETEAPTEETEAPTEETEPAEEADGLSEEQLARILSRDDGIWLFPLDKEYYSDITDWCGCRGENACAFCGEVHAGCVSADHVDRDIGHWGIDIAAPDGTEIYAPADGTVYWEDQKWDDLGYTLIVEHPAENGWAYYTVFQNLSNILVESGTKVSAGEVIAFTENSGDSEEAGYLHFAMFMAAEGEGEVVAADPINRLADIESAGWVEEAEACGMINNNPATQSDAEPEEDDTVFLLELKNHPGTIKYTFDAEKVTIRLPVSEDIQDEEEAMEPSLGANAPGRMLLNAMTPEQRASLVAIPGTDYLIASDTEYRIAPGIHENKLITVTKDGSRQTMGYAMEVDLSKPNTALVAGYGNMDPKKQGWTMKNISAQVEIYENAHPGTNVVGGVNASLFNMESGQPMGMMVMSGVSYQDQTNMPFFATFSDGSVGIFDKKVNRAQAEAKQSEKVGAPVTMEEGIAGWCVLLRNGELTQDCIDNRGPVKGYYPRSTVGIKADGSIILFQADGKQSPRSVGYTLQEVAYLMKQLGCVEAIELDEGGSSCYISQREGDAQTKLRSTPSDGSERMISTSILVLSNVAADGEFDHALLSPNNEYYTPSSTVELSALGVDGSGAQANGIPEGAVWALSATSASMGTIQNGAVNGNTATAQFVSNGTEGQVEIQLLLNSKVIGSTTIGIYHPDTLAFTANSVNLNYSEVSDLGLHGSLQGKTVTFKDGDIKWTLSDDKAGKFEGLNFVTTSNVLTSVTAKVTATYIPNPALTDELEVNVGMQPSIVMDGGDADELNYSVFGRGGCFESSFRWERENEKTCDLITVHYTNGVGGSSRGGNESAKQITTNDPQWVDKIRFGQKAVKLDYDFSRTNGIEGSCLGFARDMDLTGSPTGIGVWVYAPEGTTNLWLRAAIGVESAPGSGKFTYTYVNFTERADTAFNASGGKDFGGINWTGWKYVEADISEYAGRTIRIMRGETVRIMYTYGKYGPTIGGKVTGMGNLTKDGKYVPQADVKGWLLLDNLQFVYGANNQDTVNPKVSKMEYSYDGMDWRALEENAQLNSNDVQFRVWYEDSTDDSPFNTGVADVQFYFDENHFGRGTPSTSTGVAEYNYIRMGMPDGQHNITFFVKDNFGNITRKTQYFTVATGEESFTTLNIGAEAGASPILGRDYVLKLTTNKVSNFKSMTLKAEINSRFSVEDVTFAPGVTGTFNWKSSTGSTGSLDVAITGMENVTDPTLAEIHIKIPTNLTKGSQLNWQVTSCTYQVNTPEGSDGSNVNYGLSTPVIFAGVEEGYALDVDTWVVGKPAVVRVFTPDGAPASKVSIYYTAEGGDVLVGETDAQGVLTTDVFTKQASQWSIYAQDANDGRSFVVEVSSYPAVGQEKPYNILSNAVKDPKTEKNFSWMVNPSASDAVAKMRVSTSSDMSSPKSFAGSCEAFYYSATQNANLICKVTATGLKPGTTYYYQVGDGNVWSDVKSFTTEAASVSETNFFIIGDMQGEDAARAAVFSDLMEKSGIHYSFGIQTGDAIDNVQIYNEWQNMMGIYSQGIFTQTDNLHVIGNHEVFNGDNNGDRAIAAFGIPVKHATDWYSVEYGDVYVATIGYTLDTALMQESLNWLVKDASKSNCAWKILTIHVPTYYTNKEQTDSAFYNKNLPAAAQKAGIDFVFSGHDHSYARTKAMVDGKENANGIVYYIVGTAGDKKYTCSDNGFGFEKMTQDYGAIYLSVKSNKKAITITTYDVDDNGNATVLDEFTKGDWTCDEHDYIYNRKSDELRCKVCDTVCGAKETFYSGFARDDATDNLMYFIGGASQSGHIQVKNYPYFFDKNGFGLEGTYVIGGENCVFDDGSFKSSSNKNVVTAGYAGEDIDYVLYSNGKIKLTGSGKMEQYNSVSDVPWFTVVGKIKSIEIDPRITYIGSYSFRQASNCTVVDFGKNSQVDMIGHSSFSQMPALKSITLPENLSNIRKDVFLHDTNLENVWVPGTVSTIDKRAFFDCGKVVLNVAAGSYSESWAKSNGVKYITRSPDLLASGKCGTNATWALYSDGLLKIDGSGAMTNFASNNNAPWYQYRYKITKIQIGSEITEIGDRSFYGSCVTKVSFDENSKLRRIGAYAFFYQNKLNEIVLPQSVEEIDFCSFARCTGLIKVYLPDNVKRINDQAFSNPNCKLENLVVSVAANSYAEEWAIRTGTKYEVRGESAQKPIDSGKCGSNATWEMYSNGLLKISGSGAMTNYAGNYDAPWSKYRNSYTSIEIGAGITSIGSRSFYGHSLAQVSFEKNSKLKKVGDYAFFYQNKLTEVTLPESVEEIGFCAFARCTGLTKVYLPSGVKSINDQAFSNPNCKLDKLVLSVAADSYAYDWAVKTGTKYEVRGESTQKPIDSGKCGSNATWEMYSNGLLKIGGSGAMTDYAGNYDAPWSKYRSSYTSIEIGAGITSIGSRSFYGHSLAQVSFEKNSKLKKVGDYAFFYQNKLTEVTLPESVEEIGFCAFARCTGLTKVYLPSGVKSINDQAFSNPNCKLDKLVLSVAADSYAYDWAVKTGTKYEVRGESTQKPIDSGKCGSNATWEMYSNGLLKIGGSGAMTNYAGNYDAPWSKYRSSYTSIEIGAGITSIGSRSFYGHSLAQVSFEKNSKLKKVGDYAFFYQNKLTEVTLPESVEEIGFCAFARCTGLTKVYLPSSVRSINTQAFSNPNCTLDKLVLNVAKDTYAERWARANGVTYVLR